MSKERSLKTCHTILAGAALFSGAAIATPSAAQSAFSITPGQCLARVTSVIRTFPRAPDGNFRNPDSVRAASVRAINGCIGAFVIDSMSAPNLLPLAQLYVTLGRDRDAQAALARRLVLAPDTASQAATLLAGVQFFAAPFQTGVDLAEHLAIAKYYMARLDTLGDAAAAARLQAGMALSDYYFAHNDDSASVVYAHAALHAAEPLHDTQRKLLVQSLFVAYLRIAQVQANSGHADHAVATLARATQDIGDDQSVASQLTQMTERYQLIGKPASALVADYWLTSAGKTAPVTLPGKVTVLTFGAHWCGPCRASYPSLIHMSQEFRGKPVQLVLATNTYGYFEDHAALTPAQEVGYDTAYFFGHNKLPVTLAISNPVLHTDNEGRVGSERSHDERAYRVTVLPQTVVIDKQGIVRAVLVGWSPLNERFITSMVKQML